MAAITITAANVGFGEVGVNTEVVQYGESITQGQPVYLNSTDNKHYKADSNASSTTAAARGIALTPGSSGDYGLIAKSGLVAIGGTVNVGITYNVGATAGSIVPNSDLTTGDYVTYLGTGYSSSKILVDIKATGIVKP